MPTTTLEVVQAKQAELAALIAQLMQPAQQHRTVQIAEEIITLQPGEHYAGAVLDEHGGHLHHLVLMGDQPGRALNWQDACTWAKTVNGDLPDRQEQALLYANCKPHLTLGWHWSTEEHASDASDAWCCHFYDGTQYSLPKSAEGSAVAVRRV